MVKLGLDSWVEMAKRLKDATTRSNINKIIFQTLNTVVVFCFCYGHFLIANSFLKTWPLKIIVQKGQSKIVGNWQKDNKKWSSFLKKIWFFLDFVQYYQLCYKLQAPNANIASNQSCLFGCFALFSGDFVRKKLCPLEFWVWPILMKKLE